MTVRLQVSLREVVGGDRAGEVFVEVVTDVAQPAWAVESSRVSFQCTFERSADLWLPEIHAQLVATVEAYLKARREQLYVPPQVKRFLNISRDSEERRLLGLLIQQKTLHTAWPTEAITVTREWTEAEREYLPMALAMSEHADEAFWREATYTLNRHLNGDYAYRFGSRTRASRSKSVTRTPVVVSADAPFAAAEIGELPVDGEPTVAGITLPAGHRSAAGPPPHAPDDEAVLWCSDSGSPSVFELAGKLAAVFSQTGLWPCLWEFDSDHLESYCQAPGDIQAIDNADPARVLADLWSLQAAEPEWVEPFTRGFPGLAGRTAPGSVAVDPFAVLARHTPPFFSAAPRLVLVPCHRPGDLITLLGFECGQEGSAIAGNIALMSSVLRSWEERFHAVIVAIGAGTITLAVGAPPATLDHARQVAAEHYPLAAGDGQGEPGALNHIAQQLVASAPATAHIWQLAWS
jgi:hypothetical protein